MAPWAQALSYLSPLTYAQDLINHAVLGNGYLNPWLDLSLLLRTGIALAGFYFVAGADWKRMLLCLLGFIIARFVIMRLTDVHMARGASHAS